MAFGIALVVFGLAVAGFVYYVQKWSERDRREVMERGQPFVAYVLIAKDHIYRPSREPAESHSAGARLLIAFEPESSELHAALQALTARLLELGRREPQNEIEREVAQLVNDHSFRPGRIPIPRELTGGRAVYSYDGSVLRDNLPAGYLELPFIHCVALPGERGNVYMTPYPGDAEPGTAGRASEVGESSHPTSGGAAAGRFFIARFRGSHARFFRVYPDAGALLFLDAGPYFLTVGPEAARGGDRRHWAVRSAGAMAVGAVGAVVAVAAIGRLVDGGPVADDGYAFLVAAAFIGILLFGFGVAVPVVTRRIDRRAAELDALTTDGLRTRSESDSQSFRADADDVSDVQFAPLNPDRPAKQEVRIGATLTFRHRPTGSWTLETTTTRDTRAAIDAFREACGPAAVTGAAAVDWSFHSRTSGR